MTARRLLGPVFLLLLAAAPRLFQLDTSSLWLDEVRSLDRATQPAWADMYAIFLEKNQAPFYETVLLRPWLRLGTDEFWLRLPSVYLGLLTIALTYALARRLTNQPVAGLSAALLALSPLHIFYSREGRMYALATLFVTAALLFLWEGRRRDRPGRLGPWLGYTVTGALAIYTHYYAAFALIAMAGFVSLDSLRRRDFRQLAVFAVAELGIAVLFAPWLPTFVTQVSHNPVNWIPPTETFLVIEILASFFLYRPVLGSAFLALVPLFVIGTGAGAWYGYRQRQWRLDTPLIFVAAAALGPIVLALIVSVFKPLIVNRYLLIAVPPAAILLAIALRPLFAPGHKRWWLLLILPGIIWSAAGVFTTDWKTDWRGAAAQLAAAAEPEDMLIFSPQHFHLPFSYYYDGPQPALLINQDEQNLLDGVQAARVWLFTLDPRYSPISGRVEAYAATRFQKVFCLDMGEQSLMHGCLFLTGRANSALPPTS